MAWDKIDQFVTRIVIQYQQLELKILAEPIKENRSDMYTQQRVLFDCLLCYYDTVLQYPKFKCQKAYCLAELKRLNPALMEGYLKPIKKNKVENHVKLLE